MNEYSRERTGGGRDDNYGNMRQDYSRRDREWDRGRWRDRERDRDRDRRWRDDSMRRRRSRSPGYRDRTSQGSRRIDVDSIVPLDERKRRQNLWDIRPPGYENISAEQAKQSGLFPPSGPKPGTVPDPSAENTPKLSTINIAPPPPLLPSESREARRVVIHDIQNDCSKEELLGFLNNFLKNLNVELVCDPPIVDIYIDMENYCALAELGANEDATLLVNFGQIAFGNNKILMARPEGYIVENPSEKTPSDDATTTSEAISENVPDSFYKITLRNIHESITDEQLVEFLQTFGKLKAFKTVRDAETGESRNLAFALFRDVSITDTVISKANGTSLSGQKLEVMPSLRGMLQLIPNSSTASGSQLVTALASARTSRETPVLQLSNLATNEELLDNDKYNGILSNVKAECSKYGSVHEVKCPRPVGARAAGVVAKVFVKFACKEDASSAMTNLSGRMFNGRTVLTSYIDEVTFNVGAF